VIMRPGNAYQALEPEFRLYLRFQVEGDLMDGWVTQSYTVPAEPAIGFSSNNRATMAESR